MSASMSWQEVIFWLCLALVVYAYLGYPILVWTLARLFGRHYGRSTTDPGPLPSVSLLIAAHNEEAVIEGRLTNALALDYPPEQLEIVVASDGSSDATAAIVRRFAERGVKLLDYAERRGKAAVLNSAVAELRGDIIVLSDANTGMEACALRRLVRWFQYPAVGVVCGRLVLTDPATGQNVDGMYWKYETFLKRCEGRLGALLGANGAIYAMRRELYVNVPEHTLIDDFVIPLLAKLRSPYDIIYDSEAVAHEETAPDLGGEFRRRSRIGAGGFQCIGLLWRLLNPARGWVAFTFASHKVLRWLCPFLLAVLLAMNLWLAAKPLYGSLLAAQLTFYAVALLAPLVPARVKWFKPVRLSTMFVGMNLALLAGFWQWLRGRRGGTWARTARVAEIEAVSSCR